MANTATASGDEDDLNSADDTDGESVVVCPVDLGEANLSIVKTAESASVLNGDFLVYTFAVTNAGPDVATNVMVDDIEIAR